MIKTSSNYKLIELINDWLEASKSISHEPYKPFEQSFFDSDWEIEILSKH